MRLNERVALITGGGSGIGKASCLLFAREGARVIVVDLEQSAAEATAREIRDNGGVARSFAADVSKAGDAEAMVKSSAHCTSHSITPECSTRKTNR
jgi:2-keto-3-deoxy-L-fuconate dehydrogenase